MNPMTVVVHERISRFQSLSLLILLLCLSKWRKINSTSKYRFSNVYIPYRSIPIPCFPRFCLSCIAPLNRLSFYLPYRHPARQGNTNTRKSLRVYTYNVFKMYLHWDFNFILLSLLFFYSNTFNSVKELHLDHLQHANLVKYGHFRIWLTCATPSSSHYMVMQLQPSSNKMEHFEIVPFGSIVFTIEI